MTTFSKGQRIIATASAQGMKSGSEYIVGDSMHAGFGVVLYDVTNAADGTPIGRLSNLHLLARAADAAPAATPRTKLQIEFDDSEYRSNHGAAPRGTGSWAFIFPRPPGGTEPEPWWAAGSDGKHVATTFGLAKKLAKAEAKRRFGGTNAYIVIRVAT